MKILVRTSIIVLLFAVASIYGQQTMQNGSSPTGTAKDPRPRPAAILKEPTVLGTGETWAVISWTTNASGKDHSKIYAGTRKNDLSVVDQSSEDTATNDRVECYQEQEYEHLVRLNNLKSGTTYYFQADSGSARNRGPDSQSSIWQFTTAGVAPALATTSARRRPMATKSANAKPGSVQVPASNTAESASLHKSSTQESASAGNQPR